MEASPPDWVEVGRFRTRSEANEHALVLVAMGIDCRVVVERATVGLFVHASDASSADRELAAYASERSVPSARRAFVPARGFGDGVDGAMAYCAVLMFLFAATRREALGLDWLAAGAVQVGLIADGELWRAVTALGLHVEVGHLMGNMAMGAVLGLLVAQPLGPGLAWLAILLAGAAGNLLNALVQSPDHTAIGASTAVFAALGILSGMEWRRRASRSRRLRYWLPLAAGVALLAFLGIGDERTDIGAHVAGFVAGAATGAWLTRFAERLPQDRPAQSVYAVAATALLVVAWATALAAHG